MNPNRQPAHLLEDAERLVHAINTHWFWDGVNAEVKQDFQNKVQRLREAVHLDASSRSTRDLAVNRLSLAEKNLRKWLINARLVVMLVCGARWSEAWVATGFTNAKIRVPKQLDQRIALARSLVSFF